MMCRLSLRHELYTARNGTPEAIATLRRIRPLDLADRENLLASRQFHSIPLPPEAPILPRERGVVRHFSVLGQIGKSLHSLTDIRIRRFRRAGLTMPLARQCIIDRFEPRTTLNLDERGNAHWLTSGRWRNGGGDGVPGALV
jgi:hypothetical protein